MHLLTTRSAALLAIVCWASSACDGGADAEAAEHDSEGAPATDHDTVEQSSPLCSTCTPDFGGDTGDFGGSHVPCAGEAVERTIVTLEQAREMGFDPDTQLDATETQFEVPVRWSHSLRGPFDETTSLSIEVKRTGEATLVDWELKSDPLEGAARCHDGDYLVPHVEVTLATEDGLVDGAFEADLGPNEFGQMQPQSAAGGTMLQLFANASNLGGDLHFDIDPDETARLSIWLYALFDHPYAEPRAEIVLVLDYDDGDGWTGIEGYTASPDDACGVRALPQGEVAMLQVPADAVDAARDCYQPGGESTATCCALRDPDDPSDVSPREFDEAEGAGD